MKIGLAKEKSTHNPMLIKAILLSEGPVLEIGAGLYSTPLMHWLCKFLGRKLITYENNPEYYEYACMFKSSWHSVKHIQNWEEDLDFTTHWGAILMDHNPDERRALDVIRFKNNADYIVIHDTDREDKYNMKRAWPYFKYIYTWKETKPWTSVVSNFKDLSDFGNNKI